MECDKSYVNVLARF